jgi:superfamily II DNA/RNA helicase
MADLIGSPMAEGLTMVNDEFYEEESKAEEAAHGEESDEESEAEEAAHGEESDEESEAEESEEEAAPRAVVQREWKKKFTDAIQHFTFMPSQVSAIQKMMECAAKGAHLPEGHPLLGGKPGVGKTRTYIAFLMSLRGKFDTKGNVGFRVLALMPRATLLQVFRELLTCGVGEDEIVMFHGKSDPEALRNATFVLSTIPTLHARLAPRRRPGHARRTVRGVDDLLARPLSAIIIDEAHTMRNGMAPGAKRYRAVASFVNKSWIQSRKEMVVVNVTATPVYNRAEDLRPLLRLPTLDARFDAPGAWTSGTPAHAVIMTQLEIRRARVEQEEKPEIIFTEKANEMTDLEVEAYARIHAKLQGAIQRLNRLRHAEASGDQLKLARDVVQSLMTKARVAIQHPVLEWRWTGDGEKPPQWPPQPGCPSDQYGDDFHSSRMNSALVEIKKVMALDGEKIVVFNAFAHPLRLLALLLDEEGIDYRFHTGSNSPSQNFENAETFRSGEVRVILCTTGSGGVGINLPCRHALMMQPFWSNADLSQVVGRITRLGITGPFNCTTLSTDTPRFRSIENWMAELAQKKIDEVRDFAGEEDEEFEALQGRPRLDEAQYQSLSDSYPANAQEVLSVAKEARAKKAEKTKAKKAKESGAAAHRKKVADAMAKAKAAMASASFEDESEDDDIPLTAVVKRKRAKETEEAEKAPKRRRRVVVSDED